MPTSYTTLLGFALPATGENNGTWGDLVNASITQLLDSAIAGTTTLNTDADVTLTTTTGAANQARAAILNCTGARTAARTITAPAASKAYVIVNGTTGGYAVNIVGVGPTTGLSIANGEKALVAWNGSDFVKVSSTVITNLTGTLAVANGGTGGTTSTGTGAVVLATSPTLVTPALGTPASGTLTNTTGLPLATGVTGTLPVANGGTGQTSYTDGQLLIGNTTGNTLTKATLTAGANITVTNGNGSITIGTTGLGAGTVTSVSVASANGFAGTVATATTTPAITLTTSITGLLKGNGTAVSAASAGTDYVAPSGALGTPSSGTLTNVTGLPIDAGTTGTLGVARGGTGATTFTDAGVLIGNGTGAVQVTSAGTAGQVLTSNGAGVDPTFQTTTAGAVNVVSVTNASGASAVDFTDLAAGYDYRVRFSGVIAPGGVTSLLVRLSTDNGSTFEAGAGTYKTAGLSQNIPEAFTASNTAFYPLTTGSYVETAAPNGIDGDLLLVNPANATNYKGIFGRAGHASAAGLGSMIVFGGRYEGSTTAVNAIRFLPGSGTLTGTFILERIARSA